MTTFRHRRQPAAYQHTELVPTATVHQSRLQMFQPTRRPQSIDKTVDTAHGKIRIKGKLGQAHADVLEAIMYTAEKKGEADGRIKLLVDPAKVRQRANITSGDQLRKLIEDLEQALIEISNPANLHLEEGLGHIIDHVGFAVRSDGTPVTRHNPLGGGERKLWRVELGKSLCQLIRADIWLTYDPAPVARLSSGISQAVARHVLSHRQQPAGGWRMDTLIVAVAGELDTEQMRNRRRELRADAARLAEIGIRIAGDRVCRV